jgi:hypothetical protein
MIVLEAAAEMTMADLREIKLLATRFQGHETLRLDVRAADGEECRGLTLGPAWRYKPSAACLAALEEYGRVEIQR